MAPKLGQGVSPGTKVCLCGAPSAKERPACGLGSARCKGGVSLSQALAWNKGTCRLGTDGRHKWVMVAPRSQEGDPRSAGTGSGRVPRGTGADPLAVAMKAL